MKMARYRQYLEQAEKADKARLSTDAVDITVAVGNKRKGTLHVRGCPGVLPGKTNAAGANGPLIGTIWAAIVAIVVHFVAQANVSQGANVSHQHEPV